VFFEFRESGLGIFDGVMQSRSHKGGLVGHAAFDRENGRNRDGMIDVRGGFRILAALLAMLVGGECERSQKRSRIQNALNLSPRVS
jgi:hypothetical protein